MSETDLVAIYDLVETGFEVWRFPLMGLVFIAIGVAMVAVKYLFRALDARTGNRFSRRIKRKSIQPTWWLASSIQYVRENFAEVWLGFSMIWTALAYSMVYAAYYSSYVPLRDAYVQGRFQAVEGKIEHIRPTSDADGSDETLVVGGKSLSYSGIGCTPSIKRMRSLGAAIEKGVYVRIRHVNSRIVRLEVERAVMENMIAPPRNEIRLFGLKLTPC